MKFYKWYLILFHGINMLSGAALDWKAVRCFEPVSRQKSRALLG